MSWEEGMEEELLTMEQDDSVAGDSEETEKRGKAAYW